MSNVFNPQAPQAQQPHTASSFGGDTTGTASTITPHKTAPASRQVGKVNDYFSGIRRKVDDDLEVVQERLATNYQQLEQNVLDADAQIDRLSHLAEKYGVNADEMTSIKLLFQQKLNDYTLDLAKGTITGVHQSTRQIHEDKISKMLGGISDKVGKLLKGKSSNSKTAKVAEKALKKFGNAGKKLGSLLEKINIVQRVIDAEDLVIGTASRARGKYSSGLRENLHDWLDDNHISDIPILGHLMGTSADLGASIMENLGLNTGFKTDKEMVEQLKKGIETQIRQQEYMTGRQGAILNKIEELENNREEYAETEANLIKRDFNYANTADDVIKSNPNLLDLSYRQQQQKLREILSTKTEYARMTRKQKHDYFTNTAKWIHRLSAPNSHDVVRRNDLIRRGQYRYVDVGL